MAITVDIRFALWCEPHPTGPNANKAPYLRSTAFLSEPYIQSTGVSVTLFQLDSINETYVSFDVPNTASNLTQGFLGLASNGESSKVISGYIAFRPTALAAETLIFVNRGSAYVVNGQPLFIRVEAIGPKKEVGFGEA